MKYINLIIKYCIIILVVSDLHAQEAGAVEDSLFLDPGIRYGRLENGFTYYIKNLPQSGSKVLMELAVKAGSRYEDKDQYSMAHFLEHLPFVRTEHFTNIVKNTEMLSELQMQSTDIRGITGGEETIYSFDYPSGNEEAFSTGPFFLRI